jgi:hypothetical protein
MSNFDLTGSLTDPHALTGLSAERQGTVKYWTAACIRDVRPLLHALRYAVTQVALPANHKAEIQRAVDVALQQAHPTTCDTPALLHQLKEVANVVALAMTTL